MRRRLVVMALAVTTMVVLAFLVPLAVLVRDLAEDRALSTAERDAESVARFLAVLGPSRGTEGAVDAIGGARLSEFATSVILPDDTVIGSPLSADDDLTVPRSGTSVRATVEGGQAVYVPVVQEDGSAVVVRVFVPEADLRAGVMLSWLTLGILGLLLVAVAVLVSDRLARTVVEPARDLQSTAARLGEGNLEARVEPAGPEEIRDIGTEFNRLAERVERLLQQERETAADLSHQLRTPLTALKLDVEALPPGTAKQRLLDDLDHLERRIDFVITEARREVRRETEGSSDLAALVEDRVAYWAPLADEQGREVGFESQGGPITVAIPPIDAEAMIDALIGNVFAHTAEATPFAVTLSSNGEAVLVIEDGGPGFVDSGVVERGFSHGPGTGLGLDIARRTVTSAGGAMELATGLRLGGALVRLRIPVQAH